MNRCSIIRKREKDRQKADKRQTRKADRKGRQEGASTQTGTPLPFDFFNLRLSKIHTYFSNPQSFLCRAFFAELREDVLLWLAKLPSIHYLLPMTKTLQHDIQKLWQAHQEVLASGKSSLFSAETAGEILVTAETLALSLVEAEAEAVGEKEKKGRKGAGKDLCSSSPAHSSLSKCPSVPVPLRSL